MIFDERLVPHVFAQSEEDIYFLQGYLHAKYRLWQMDITQRQTSGRLSEVLGSSLLEHDMRMRRMGLLETAKKYVKNWKKTCPDINLFQNYIDGANTYISKLKKADLPLEFKLLNYKPEPWSLEKSALVVMNMNLILCGRNEDIAATNTLNRLGREKFDLIFPKWNPKESPVIPSEKKWKNSARITENPSSKAVGFFKDKFIQSSPRGIGSNNWAVGKELTRDGSPILCNDPHLSLTLPSIWYELHINSPERNAYGVSIPGVPNIVIGFNDRIAWGETNVGMDVSDLFEVEWVDDEKLRYKADGKIESATMRIEEYMVKGIGIVTDTVKMTKWGPVFFEDDRSLALKWLPNFVIENCINQTFHLLNRAQDHEEYYEALRYFKSPAQNFVFASKENIALKVQGEIPIKNRGEGQFIWNSTDSSTDWRGSVPHDETPYIKNPDRGFVSSANQYSTDTTYPYKYHGYFEDYRGRTVNEKLSLASDITVEDMMSLQNDVYDKSSEELCRVLFGLIEGRSPDDKYLDQLRNWDYKYESDKAEPIIFDIWKNKFYSLVWDEFINLEKEGEEEFLFPELWNTIKLAEEEPSSFVFDLEETNELETAEDIAAMSFEECKTTCDSLFTAEPKMTWKDYRPVNINHMARISAFSESNVNVGGIGTAINAIKSTHGPSWRMIVQMGSPVKAWAVYPGGQSGNPGSAFYKNMIEKWSKGEYYEVHFTGETEALKDVQLFTIDATP